MALIASVNITCQAEVDAGEKLAKATYFYDLYNRAAEGLLFAEAEKLFEEKGDQRNALFSHIGYLATEPGRPLTERDAELRDLLANHELLQKDKGLRLFALTVKGYLDGELDVTAARIDWEEVTVLAQQLNQTKWIYRALGELGFTDYYNGDLASCERKVTEALIAATQAGDIGAQVYFLSTIANGYRMEQQWLKASIYAKQAIALAGKYPDVGHPYIANQALIAALAQTGQVEEAKTMCLTLLRNADMPAERLNFLVEKSNIAQLQGRTPDAIADLQAAIDLQAGLGASRGSATYQSVLSSLYVEAGNLPKAEELARKAVQTLEQINVVVDVPPSLGNLARVLASEGKYDEAEQAYERADLLQDAMIGKADSIVRKTALITGVSEIYSHHFALIAEQIHDTAKAYQVAEQARGRVVTDLLLAGAKVSPAALETERQISELRLRLMKTQSGRQAQEIRNAIFLKEQERGIHPEINLLNTHNFQPLPVETVQNSLSESEAIFEYVLSDPHSYCLVLTHQTRYIVRLEGERTIAELVKQYLQAIQDKQSGRELAARLYNVLLKPIPETKTKKRLTIIRDGNLHLLPFDALIDEQHQYVVQSKTIFYAPSATSFYLLRSRPQGKEFSAALLAVGGVPYGASGIKKTAITRGYSPDALSDLPSSQDEVLQAAAALRSPANQVLTGRKATETAFKQASAYPYRYIHLAVHAFPNDDPNRAALVLLSDPAHGEDGFLQSSEIVQMKLKTDLVVLSACETAVGPLQGEEGISTLANAFLLAGARTVVSTLWTIEDEPSLFLMKRFYQHLKANTSPAEAMSNAKRDMLKTFGTQSLPLYWAGFTVEGADHYAPATNEIH